MQQLYAKVYPTREDLEGMSLPQLIEFERVFSDDMALIEEETRMFSEYHKHLLDKDSANASSNHDGHDGGNDEEEAIKPGMGKPIQLRRGQNWNTKADEQRQVFLSVEDRWSIVKFDQSRLEMVEKRNEALEEDQKDFARAKCDEAKGRISELSLETSKFKREVLTDKNTVNGDAMLKYMEERPIRMERYTKALAVRREGFERKREKIATQLRSRQDSTGDNAKSIDFEQLEIENAQFQDRIKIKNAELVDLKQTTTKTVHDLNNLTDKLNEMWDRKTKLEEEKTRRENHVKSLLAEIESVKKEAVVAEQKNAALKIKHESVKVPKVEEYIAQKAETYDLQKVCQNWKRKVEITEGHVAVMKQQINALTKKKSTSVKR